MGVVEAPAGHRQVEPVRREACEVDGGRADQRPGLDADGVEDRGSIAALRDKRRHPAQSRLLVGQPAEVVPRLCVRDRRRDQLRELGEPILGPGRQGLVLARERHHRPPRLAVDEHRNADGRPDPRLTRERRRDLARHLRVVHAGRAAGLRNPAGHAELVEIPAGADRERILGAPDADLRRGPVRFEADDRCEPDPERGRDLLGDRGEDLGLGRLLRDERRDAPQRGLLLDDTPQVFAGLGVRDRDRDESVNAVNRSSAPSGRASSSVPVTIAPQIVPSATMGIPSPVWKPPALAPSAILPGSSR